MTKEIDRREFLKLAGMGMGGVVYMSAIGGQAALSMPIRQTTKDFFFVQLSDCHWGFEGAKINPDAKGTLVKAVKEVNSLQQKPDFIVFTGDLTQTTDDTSVRKARMREFKQIVAELDSKAHVISCPASTMLLSIKEKHTKTTSVKRIILSTTKECAFHRH
jgi:predicted MPP superfamily phosphohydrolase